MANDDTLPITFSVPGQSGPVDAATSRSLGGGQPQPPELPGQVKASVRVATLRDGGSPVRVTAVPGEDIVALHIQDGPVLLLHPATARDLVNGAGAPQRGQAGDDVAVQVHLQWPGADVDAATRDLSDVGHVVVSAFQVITGLFKDKIADFAAGQIVQRVDGQVTAGVYSLGPDKLDKLKDSGTRLDQVPAATGPMLVLLHGTFVDTHSTFEKLWLQHPTGVARLFEAYGDRVYALDHPTLGKSPIANALTLVDALPDGARLHLVSHSRGGLVAEVLARLAGQTGIGTAELDFFADAAYAGQRDELSQLAALMKAKHVQVERVVRVACPARGTLLASKRLDAYVSVLKWTLEVAGVPVLPAFVDFVGEVARRRADPSEIPGLAAMMPDTPLVNWLNAAPQNIPGDLRVVAGDLQHGTTLGSWLKVLLADAYYWTDNDIVVHTRSMYGGAPRAGGASFLLDQGSGVTHFTYFANDKTADAVVSALTDAQPAGFRPIGPLSWAGKDSSGQRGLLDETTASKPDPRKPAVFVLPGILGTNLKQAGDRIWLSPRLIGGFTRLAYQPDGADTVLDDGPIGMVYSDLTAFLDASHEVIPFGYDWRRPLEEEATRLAQRVREALDARAETRQPVRILAHSMGGLLARTMQLVDPDTWRDLMAHPEARLLMLGTPNSGSWAPMQVLSGDDTFGNALAAIGSPFANKKARGLMALMPGFLQLQAGLLDDKLKLGDSSTWQALADDDYKRELQKNWWQRYAGDIVGAAYAWGVPTQGVLDAAKTLRQRLDAQADGALKDFAAKILLVVGHAKFTPDGFDVGGDGFVYLDAQDGGDGRVPLESALLPGVMTWTLDCEHGKLPSAKQAFDAFLDLLARGTTAKLTTLAASTVQRDGSPAATLVHVRSRPSRRPPSALPAGDASEIFSSIAMTDGDAAPAPLPPLKISVLNGNLTFVRQPIMLGHYRALELTGSEREVDGHIGGAMGTALRAGIYPESPDSHRIFFNTRPDQENPWQPPRPRAVIVVGLGEEGALTATQLEHSVAQGAKAWSQRAAEQAQGSKADIELSAVLIGSGGIGISAGTAARAIAQGVRKANQRLVGSGWPLISRLTLVELYLDRAGEAWHGLRVLEESAPQAYQIAPTIASGTGPLRCQPQGGYRGADYDLINTSTASENTISFALDTRRARTEVRATRTQPKLLEKLIRRAATARSSDPMLGSTLFKLLVPMELQPFLSGNDRLVMQLDAGTAPIPWELLDSGRSGGGTSADGARDSSGGSEPPWAIRTRMLRKLSTGDFRSNPRDAHTNAAVLVIGEPKIDDLAYPELPGARAEAQAVVEALRGPGGIRRDLVTALTDDPEFDAVIVALMARPYRVVHIAGHGAPIQRDPTTQAITSRGGVVLSEGIFLGPDEIAKLPDVPELVFVNCCHLGAADSAQTLKVAEPPAFAASVADELIKIGVRCVVAAGWAVDDLPAMKFAQRFYAVLLRGRPFVDAVVEARKAALAAAPNSKTWAAYQCYGDPNWTFCAERDDGSRPAASPGDEFQGIASAVGLALMLESLAVRTRFQTAATIEEAAAQQGEARRRLVGFEKRYAELWGGMGAIAEAFAVAWDAAGDRDQAIAWYGRALAANDASASIKAHEQFGDLRIRRAWKRARTMVKAADSTGLTAAREEIEQALAELQGLAALQPTIERLSLCGSGFKLLAQTLQLQGGADAAAAAAATAALQQAFDAYSRAEALAATSDDAQLFFPGLNRMAIELVLRAGQPGWPGFAAAASAEVRRSLQALHDKAPDFWTNAAFIEFDLYAAVAAGELSAAAERLSAAYADLHTRVAAHEGYWGPASDQALFVLRAYAADGRGAELQAAQALLDQLAAYAN